MKTKRVFDSFALLAYLKKEARFEKVKNLLSEKDPQIFINDINVGEVYYILAIERAMRQISSVRLYCPVYQSIG